MDSHLSTIINNLTRPEQIENKPPVKFWLWTLKLKNRSVDPFIVSIIKTGYAIKCFWRASPNWAKSCDWLLFPLKENYLHCTICQFKNFHSILYPWSIQTTMPLFLILNIKFQFPYGDFSLSFQIRGWTYQWNIYFLSVTITFIFSMQNSRKETAYNYNLQSPSVLVKQAFRLSYKCSHRLHSLFIKVTLRTGKFYLPF